MQGERGVDYRTKGKIMSQSSALKASPALVIPIKGELMRFHVKSRSSNREHLVDLSEYGMNGQCDCEWFIYKCEPKLARGEPANETLECWHIRQAKRYWWFHYLPSLLAALEKGGYKA